MPIQIGGSLESDFFAELGGAQFASEIETDDPLW